MNEFERKKTEQEIYRDATIRRESYNDADSAKEANSILRAVGQGLSPSKEILYQGSAAVHIYFAPGMQEAIYVTQNCIDKECNEIFASSGISELMRTVAGSYGRTLGKKRSGF